ncbi:MAG: hypothetical protein ABWZ40_06305 [Caulobacterales bacterium]
MEEYPIKKVPDIANWSENFAFACFDPVRSISFFCHIGRWRRDLSLWREVVTVALPDGTVLAHRHIGSARATERGPGGSNFHVDVVEPGKTFCLAFLGGVRRISEADLFEGPLRDGPHYRLGFDVTFEGVAPVWDLSSEGHKTEFMGAGHVEQFGRFTGDIHIGADVYKLDTVGNRDHSRGPRVFDSNIRHIWLHGVLDDGTMFQLYEGEVAGREGPAFSEANLVIGGVAHKGRPIIHDRLPFTNNRGLVKDPVRFSVEHSGGALHLTATKIERTISMQSTSPNDMYIGRRQEDADQNTTVLEQGVRYKTDDGRTGYGHLERLVPGKLLVDPA